MKTMTDLTLHFLQDIYYAENQITKALPKMIDSAKDAELKRGLQQHLRETQEQVRRLEQVFKLPDRTADGAKCPAIDGIIREGDDLMGNVDDPDVLGAGLIAAAQAVCMSPHLHSPTNLGGKQTRTACNFRLRCRSAEQQLR